MARGGKREGAGRKKGAKDSPNEYLSREARKYADQALKALVTALTDNNVTARINAAKEILDRGHGKPAQSITGEDGGDIQITIKKVVHSAGNND